MPPWPVGSPRRAAGGVAKTSAAQLSTRGLGGFDSTVGQPEVGLRQRQESQSWDEGGNRDDGGPLPDVQCDDDRHTSTEPELVDPISGNRERENGNTDTR